jgi:uncharacterized protein (TIGR02996 family)
MLAVMNATRQALFQAVLDRPGDDAPRLAYADACDAEGDPYGAFIRAQLARTHALRSGSDEDASSHREEADRIRRKDRRPAWTNGIERLASPEFVRGFVDRVSLDARRYLDHAGDIYRRAPIRQLVLTGAGELVAEVVRDPRIAQLVWLTFEGKPTIGDAGIAAIAASPHVRSLLVLGVADQGITRSGLDLLCASQALGALVYANVTGNQFDSPVEGFGTEWSTGRIDLSGAYLPPLGHELEAKFGTIAWLHAPSRLRQFPPDPEGV